MHSILAMRSEKPTENRSVHSSSIVDKPGRRLPKNNSVYMGQTRENEGQREERNKIYVEDASQN